MATILEVQQRIVDLCPLIELPAPLGVPIGIKAQSECSFADAELPIVEVIRGRGLRNAFIAVNDQQRVREYILRLFVQRIKDDTKEPDAAAEELAANCVEPVLDFFAVRRALELQSMDDTGIVSDAQILQDTNDTKLFANNRQRYTGVAFRMQVITRHFHEE